MSVLLRIFKQLKRKFFGGKIREHEVKKSEGKGAGTGDRRQALDIVDNRAKDKGYGKRRDPYFVQIGLDFGTSYSKCVCRDIITDKAWIHLPRKTYIQELPFLIPSSLIIENNVISHVEDGNIGYAHGGIYNLKHALSMTARGILEDPVFVPFKNAVHFDRSELPELVTACAVYLLAGILGEIRAEIRSRFRGFGSAQQDYMAVNLALPVQEAEQDEIYDVFRKVLGESWGLADELRSHPPIHLRELVSLRKSIRDYNLEEACFVYPEVSANVQGFVRSRVSSAGIYLFNDTGGGTVDQSVFILSRDGRGDLLTYLCGRVLPLGSAKIEEFAAEISGRNDIVSLEDWRKRKERGENCLELERARSEIFKSLAVETERTLSFAKQKLYVKKQLNEIRIIFGGGGDCQYPYRNAVESPFNGQLFAKSFKPDVIGMPVPKDISLKDSEVRWMKRLSVAYGLSFEKNELVPFMFPSAIPNPRPEQIWRPKKSHISAPTKDLC